MIDLSNDDAVKAFCDEVETFGQRLNEQLDGVRDPDVLGDSLSGLRLRNPRATGQLIMELIHNPLGSFDGEEKIFWAEVADHMGPNWIENMRSIAAFMQMVDNFKARGFESVQIAPTPRKT